MKKSILPLLSLLFFTTVNFAQSVSKTYAITGKPTNNFFWADIKQVDITTGKVSNTLFEADKTVFRIVDVDKTMIGINRQPDERPTGLGVAACAFDARHNRLYFATIHFADIRYLELDRPGASFATIKRTVIPTKSNTGYQPEENHITRMVIGADGTGYALSNDANHFIRFGTGRNALVEDLGSLIDAATNEGISIHHKSSSWGGDMVADAFGQLVIVSANRNIFNIDVTTKVATFKGTITGLPANFTTNGAAVNDEGELVVSSANVFEGLFKVDMKTLVAERIVSTDPTFNASDLANGNLLRQKEADHLSKLNIIRSLRVPANMGSKLYPNPVSGTSFNLAFDRQPAGMYTILLTDGAGRTLQSQVANISKPGQVEAISFTGRAAKGVYLVKVLNSRRQLAFSEKMVVN